MSIPEQPPLVRVRDLVKSFPVHGGLLRRRSTSEVRAVDGISFEIRSGETFGLVGESGCGKTTTGRLLVRLLEASSGSIEIDGRELTSITGAELSSVRQSMQFVFQDPFGSLNPRMTVADLIAEPMDIQGGASAAERSTRIKELLQAVGLEPQHGKRYPHAFSGGQRQRIGIARALCLNPRFLVCDEAVSALDVSIRAQIINLLKDLQTRYHLTYLFIAHDLAAVRHISDTVAVMYLGRLVEVAPKRDLFDNPLHPYTRALLAAVPEPDPRVARRKLVLSGDVPNPINPPSGCHLHTRCPIASNRCRHEQPRLRRLAEGHSVACHHPEGERAAEE